MNSQFSSGALCKLLPDRFLCTASAENCRLLQEPQIQNYLKLCLQMFLSGYFLALQILSAFFRSLSSYYLSMHAYIHASLVISRAETLNFFTTRNYLLLNPGTPTRQPLPSRTLTLFSSCYGGLFTSNL